MRVKKEWKESFEICDQNKKAYKKVGKNDKKGVIKKSVNKSENKGKLKKRTTKKWQKIKRRKKRRKRFLNGNKKQH